MSNRLTIAAILLLSALMAALYSAVSGDQQRVIADQNQAQETVDECHHSCEFYYQNQAANRRQAGDYTGAIAYLNRSIMANPNFARAFVERGRLKSDLGDKQGALADYSQVIAMLSKPGDASDSYDELNGYSELSDAYIYRGNVKSDLGDNQGAIADYSHAIASKPNNTANVTYKDRDDAFLYRGNTKYAMGDYQGAIADYSQAIAISPNYEEAYKKRGDAKSDSGDKQGAIADHNKIRAIRDMKRKCRQQLESAFLGLPEPHMSPGDQCQGGELVGS